MRRALVILLLCIFCTACSNEKNLSSAIDFRTKLAQKGCSFTADVTADFGQTVEHFVLDCKSDENAVLSFTVKEPQTLSGITATVSEDGAKITYDGMAMDFGLLANGNVIPAAAPAIVVTCWQKEYISASGQEESLQRVTYEKNFDKNRLIVDTWYEKNLPICAEICYNDQRIIKIAISNFSFN